MHRFFEFKRYYTSYRQETIAGVTTFLTIVPMIFTYNIGVGMTSGMITYVLLKACTGRSGEVKAGMWVLALLSASLFVFMPKM
jgi:adenine/guanine/hypoxanthine permease